MSLCFALYHRAAAHPVIYKMGGNNGPSPRSSDFGHASGQYDPTLTDVPQPEPSQARDDWKPIPGTSFQEASRGDDEIRRVLEMVCAAVVPK